MHLTQLTPFHSQFYTNFYCVCSFFLSFLFLPTFLFVFQNRCRVFQFPLTFLSYFLVEFALLFFILARIVDCYPYSLFAVLNVILLFSLKFSSSTCSLIKFLKSYYHQTISKLLTYSNFISYDSYRYF